MRKILVVLTVMGMLVSPVIAEEVMEATGTVDSMDPVDPARGDYDGGIILRDTDSAIKNFDVTVTTVISDQIAGKISSGDIQDGDKVKVTYSVSDEGPAAITILRLPAGEVVKPVATTDKEVSGK